MQLSQSDIRQPKFKAAIFDLDGTLVDTYPALLESLNHVLSAFSLPAVDPPMIKKMVGRGLENLMRQAVGEERLKEGIMLFRSSYDQTHLRGSFLFPDVKETLLSLRRLGTNMAVASNKPSDYSRNILKHLDINQFFLECFGPDRGVRPKPDPEMLRTTMQVLQSTSEETLYVGDMILDVETARNAGVPVALISTGGYSLRELRDAHPDYLFPHFQMLLTIF